MKTITLTLSFAAALAAQQPAPVAPDPMLELAAPVAAETQERDLAKAERLYREAIDGGKLSVEGRQVAVMRLARMLRTLGREKEGDALMEKLMRETPVTEFDDVTAVPQDAARAAVLRGKAEELIRRHVDSDPLHRAPGAELQFVHHEIANQLLWIGEPVVPVAIAAIEAAMAAKSYHPDTVKGLAGMLWRIGGRQAADWLAAVAKNPEPAFRRLIVATASHANTPAMLDVAATFLRDPDDGVFRDLLQSGHGHHRPLLVRLAPSRIVDAAIAGSAARRAEVLMWVDSWNDQQLGDESVLSKIVQIARAGLQDTDPALGAAARRFLTTQAAQRSADAIELVLKEMPRGNPVPVSPQTPLPRPRFTKEEAERLLPVLVACVEALGAEASVHQKAWVGHLLLDIAAPFDSRIVPELLTCLDRGFGNPGLLDGRLGPANVLAVAERFGRLEPDANRDLLFVLARVDLPAEVFDALRAKAPAAMAKDANLVNALVAAMASTGHPDAAGWLVEHAPEDRLPAALVRLGRRSSAEPVRAAMRTLVERRGRAAEPARDRLLLALFAMHDVPSLELLPPLVSGPEHHREQHPYRTKEAGPLLSPIEYLAYRDVDPPHGFSEDEVIGVLQKIAARGVPTSWKPRFWSVAMIPDRVLGEFARLTANARTSAPYDADWVWEIQARLQARAERNEPLGPLEHWHREMLATPAAHVILFYIDEFTAARLRPQIERLVDSEDGQIAFSATNEIERHFHVRTIEWATRLIGNREKSVREKGLEIAAELRGEAGEALALRMTEDPTELRGDAAAALGAMVSVKAVPRLVELLRDPESYVREKAAEALTRIRFCHEQQAHWDRVLKGLDASPASAAEKLLLQAKPGAPKAQRLLALKSLGILGVPEALPFLIDWTGDADAEVAAAATAAITAIHLDPKR